MEYNGKKIEYYIFDPTGNITALAETAVDIADQPAVASEIMALHPEVEQVGFVAFNDEDANQSRDSSDIYLRMAGGEFCGNAAMCAAALYLIKRGPAAQNESTDTCDAGMDTETDAAARTQVVRVSVSGAADPISVRLRQMRHEIDMQTHKTWPAEERSDEGTVCEDRVSFEAAAEMPQALSIDEIKFNMESPSNKGKGTIDSGAFFLSLMNMDKLPLVRMEGIDHIIIEKGSAFYNLKDNRSLAEMFIKKWCGMLASDCLGIMFLGPGLDCRKLTPLVYVPGADTVFWENSCASGSAAAGIYLAAQAGTSVDVTFDEPAGRLRVESDPLAQTTIFHGRVVLR